MKEINWFDFLTEERKRELIKDATIELRVLVGGGTPLIKEESPIVLGECSSAGEKEKLVLFPGGTLGYKTTTGQNIFPIVYPDEYQEVVKKFQITPDQLRAIRLSFVEKSAKIIPS